MLEANGSGATAVAEGPQSRSAEAGIDVLRRVMADFRTLPPMVLGSECATLRERLAAVAEGRAFLAHCGRPASTGPISAEAVRATVRVLRQMALIIAYTTSLPLVQVAQIGGPRTDRPPMREELREEHRRALGELNLFRALTGVERFDLREAHASTMRFVRSDAVGGRYDAVAGPMDRAVRFLEACAPPGGINVDGPGFFVSWEAGPLGYEAAMTRREAAAGPHYNTCGHLIVLRESDQNPYGPHAEYCARIGNPIAVRIGPATRAAELVALLGRLDPGFEPGRIVLLLRAAGAALVARVAAAGHPVVWLLDAAADEPRELFGLLQEHGARVGGVHARDSAGCIELAFSLGGR